MRREHRDQVILAVDAAIQKYVQPVANELRLAMSETATVQGEYESAVFRNATPAGCLRAGGEALAVEHAKAAGWLAVGQDVLQYDAEGNVVGRDFAGWLNANKAEFPFAFEAGSIAADDRESFSRHLDAIASGLVTVAPRG